MKVIFIVAIIIFFCNACDYKKAASNDRNMDTLTKQQFSHPDNLSTDSTVRADLVKMTKASDPKMELEPDTLSAVIGSIIFSITTDGRISWGSDPKDSMRLNTDAWIGNIYLAIVEHQNLVVVYEENFATEGGSSAEMFDMAKKQRIWEAPVAGFNLGPAYIKDDFVYVNTIGMVGKLKLKTGDYVYRFDDLYNRETAAFNSFKSIQIKDSLAYFISKNYRSRTYDTVIVNELTRKTIKNYKRLDAEQSGRYGAK
jgi:hypothetical protein